MTFSFLLGGVLLSAAVRKKMHPSLVINCSNCELEAEAEDFTKAGQGCKQWCQCCGVFDDDKETERYCLATCEQCQEL